MRIVPDGSIQCNHNLLTIIRTSFAAPVIQNGCSTHDSLYP